MPYGHAAKIRIESLERQLEEAKRATGHIAAEVGIQMQRARIEGAAAAEADIITFLRGPAYENGVHEAAVKRIENGEHRRRKEPA